MPAPDHALEPFTVRAILVGTRLDLAAFGAPDRAFAGPVCEPLGPEPGRVFLFRYGAVVFCGVPQPEMERHLVRVAPHVVQPVPQAERETEALDVRIDAAGREGMEGTTLVLADATPAKLSLVADIMAKSVSLALYERAIDRQFERIEPFAVDLDHWGRGGRAARELLQHLGTALLAEHRVVAGARVDDAPDLLWEHPEWERLWARLREEFEIRERFAALHAKLGLISRTAGTALELLQARRSLRVEWAIVGLIVFEILLALIQGALRTG